MLLRHFLLSTVFLATATAQDPGLVRRDAGGPDISSLTPETLPFFIANQDSTSDYGVQEVLLDASPWEIFSLNASAGYDFQSNAALSPTNEVDDQIFRQSVSLRATAPLEVLGLPTSYLDFSVQEQTLRYEELDILDFDRLDSTLNLIHITPKEIVASLGTRYYRLSAPEDFQEELFANFSVVAALSRTFTVGRNGNFLVSANADVSLFASSEAAQRSEYGIVSAYVHKIAPRWEVAVSGSVGLLDYQDHDDWNYSASLALEYSPRPWLSVGASFAYSLSESDLDTFDYENITAGPNIRASFRF